MLVKRPDMQEQAGKQKGLRFGLRIGALGINPGGDLRSHTVTRAVSSAQRGLTSVFGMGTGVTPAIWPPGKSMSSNTKIV